MRPAVALALALGLGAAGSAHAQDTCDVELQLDDPGPFGLVAFSVDYTSVSGDFVGDSTIPGFGPSWGTEALACQALVANDEFTAVDDNAGVLTIVVARLDGTLAGPVPLVSCVLALDAGFPCPAAGDFAIIDAVIPDDPIPTPIPIPPAPAVSVTVSPRTPVCGDGFREGTEACDDGNTADGDCCSSTCILEPAGTPCPDADLCTGDETCDGTGSCIVGSTLDCDDGLPCTHDVCNPSVGCEALVEPDPACHPMTKAKLRVVDRQDNDSADRFKINAKTGGVEGAIGDPTTTTEYGVCVFDADGGLTTAPLQMVVPPGSPWVAKGASGRFHYTDPARSNAGIEKIRLKQSASGAIKLLLLGKGPNLPLPGPVDADGYFAADPEVTIQIVTNDASCWRSKLSTIKNDARQFQGID